MSDSHSSPEHFSVLSAETSAHRTLREEFERLEVWNRTAINQFDPFASDVQEKLPLYMAYGEYEALDTVVAEAKRLNMLRRLGLEYAPSVNEEDSSALFSCAYGNGQYESLWIFERLDGVAIPVWTRMKSNEQGNGFEFIKLLSHDKADEVLRMLEEHLEKDKLKQLLKEHLELSEELVDWSELDVKDLRSFVTSLKNIEKL